MMQRRRINSRFLGEHLIDTELVEQVVGSIQRGKADGLDDLSEHLLYCHPLLLCILAKLFNMFLRCGHVPAQFGQSYMVPIMKGSISNHSKNLTSDD